MQTQADRGLKEEGLLYYDRVYALFSNLESLLNKPLLALDFKFEGIFSANTVLKKIEIAFVFVVVVV